MTIAEYLTIPVQCRSCSDVLASDIQRYNTYELDVLQKFLDGTNVLKLLCNQLIWNHLLQADVLTPSSWGPHTLWYNVCCTAVHVPNHVMYYTFHTLPAEPLNILSSGYRFEEYGEEVADIIKFYHERVRNINDMINAGVPTEQALKIADEIYKMEWYLKEVYNA